MRSILLALAAGTILLAAAPVQGAITYDLGDALYDNIIAGGTGGSAAQLGNDGWYFKYERVAPWGGWKGNPISRNPANFALLELAYDGTNAPYGWLSTHNPDRGTIRNGNWSNISLRSGTTQGDAVYAVSENGVQVAIEWKPPGAGTADVHFELAGRNHDESDMQWHLGHWDGSTWSDLGFVLVTKDDTPSVPETLGATGLALSASDSLFLYGYVWDHDAYDGTVIRGGLTFTPAATGGQIPEPTTFLIWSLLAGLGTALGWRRRR